MVSARREYANRGSRGRAAGGLCVGCLIDEFNGGLVNHESRMSRDQKGGILSMEGGVWMNQESVG